MMAVEPAASSTAYYYTKDDIANFKIRVRLRELSSAELISASPRATVGLLSASKAEASQDKAEEQALQKQQLFSEEVVLTWQQKVVRPNASIDDVASSSKDNRRKKRPERRVFTFTHRDPYCQHLLQLPATTSRRRNRELPHHGGSSVGGDDDEREAPPPDLPRSFTYVIMADLQPRGCEFEEASSVTLCCLRYDTRGELAVTPDFCHAGDHPYRIEGPDGTNFEYTIENASLTRPEKEGSISAFYRPKLTADEWSSDDDDEGGGGLQLTVTGELTRLLNCAVSGDVYLSYAVYVPPGWTASRETECEGVSVVCRTRRGWSGKTPGVYCMPLSLRFFTHSTGNGWPVLLVGAFAVDGDGGEMDVGWATIDLAPPASRGEVSHVPMWSPAPVTPSSALQRTFLTGCRLLPSASYLAPYTARHEISRVSRFGLVTNTTGTLEYRLQTLLRSSLDLPHPGALVSQLPGRSEATKRALAAFRKSRRKLHLITAGIKTKK